MPWFDPEIMGGAIDATMTDTDALLFGRRTRQTMAAAWPDRAGSDPFDDPIGAVAALKADPGGTLLVLGSTQLTTALLGAGLVDELLLMIEPVLLGGGKTIFPHDREMRALALASVQTTGTGVLVCTYRPGDIAPTAE